MTRASALCQPRPSKVSIPNMYGKGKDLLTGKQQHFARLIAAGEMPQWACYAEAYDADGSMRETMRVNACRLAADTNVALMVQDIRASLSGDAVVTLEGHIQELNRLKGVAEDGKNYGAAVRSEELRGKVAGHYVDRIRNETPDELSVSDFCTINGRVVPEAVRLVERAMEILAEVERGGIPHLVKEAS